MTESSKKMALAAYRALDEKREVRSVSLIFPMFPSLPIIS